MILAIMGHNKTGKSTLALTAPKPLVHYDFDLGFERAAVRFRPEVEDGSIRVKRYPLPPQGLVIDETGKVEVSLRKDKRIHGVREVWEEFIQDLVKGLMDDNIASHVIDTATQTWETCHRSFLQEKQDAQGPNVAAKDLRERLLPVEYGEPNARMKAIIYTARTYGKNLILTHYVRERYEEVLTDRGKEERRTGEFELDGFKYTGGLVDMVVTTSVERNVPQCRIDLSGLGLSLQGMTLKEPTWGSLVSAVNMASGSQ